jgi:hypothetical protein
MIKGLGAVVLVVFAVAAAVGPRVDAAGYTGGGGPGKPTLTLSVPKQKLAKVRRKGLKVKATCSQACITVVNATKGSKVLGRGTKRLPNKTGTVKVKFTKAGKKRLKRARSIKLKLRGRARNDSSQLSDIVSKTVKLKRKR